MHSLVAHSPQPEWRLPNIAAGVRQKPLLLLATARGPGKLPPELVQNRPLPPKFARNLCRSSPESAASGQNPLSVFAESHRPFFAANHFLPSLIFRMSQMLKIFFNK
jgi:hypothetical protein